MKKKMNWKLFTPVLMMLVLALTFIPAGKAEAALTHKELFRFAISDGQTTKVVPVNEYKTGSKTYVKAKSGYRKLTFAGGASKLTFKVISKTAYFAENYQSVRYVQNVSFTKSRSLKLSVMPKSGSARTFELSLKKGPAPKITSLKRSRKTVTTGKSKVRIDMKVTASQNVETYIAVRNSAGKTVYSSQVQTGKSGKYKHFWTGADSNGAYVASGTYTINGYLSYKIGDQTYRVTKKTTVTVKNTNAATTSSTTTNTTTANTTAANTAASNVTGSDWAWKVTLQDDPTLDYLAEIICREVLNNSMTEAQRAKALFKWTFDFKYVSRAQNSWKNMPSHYDVTSASAKAAIAAYAEKTKALKAAGKADVDRSSCVSYLVNWTTHRSWATSMLLKGAGDCGQMSLAYETLMRHAGVKCVSLENTFKSGQGHHIWNAFQVNGSWYFCDVNRGMQSKNYSAFGLGSSMKKEKLYSSVIKISQPVYNMISSSKLKV